MSEEQPRRPNRREASAAATRLEVMRAARRLFTENGYTATTINQIATEAGVAVQTVYSSVGGKTALVLALIDFIDAEGDVGPLAAQVARSEDPDAILATAVRITRQLNERCGDIMRVLLTAEQSDPELAAAARTGLERHRAGAEQTARRLASLAALRPGVDPDQAAVHLALMTSAESWRQLTGDFGWSYDRAEEWLVDALRGLLLGRGSPADG